MCPVNEFKFAWFHDMEAPSGDYLLPVGEATIARMRFLPTTEIERHRSSRGRLVFGYTIEVSDQFTRAIVLDVATKSVEVSRLDDDEQFVLINSTLDTFVSCLATYQLWHSRLLAAGSHPTFEALVAEARAHLARLDPAAGSSNTAWWPTRIEAVGLLV